MRRPPLVVVFVAVLMIALGETAGTLLSPLRSHVERYAERRIAANAPDHGLVGAPEYDAEVRAAAVYAAEAGLSFFHTHAQGLGPLVIFVATIAANAVPWRWTRAGLYGLLAIGALFPLGYLAYALAVLERGRDAGVELAETYLLAPLGSAVIAALIALAALMATARLRRTA